MSLSILSRGDRNDKLNNSPIDIQLYTVLPDKNQSAVFGATITVRLDWFYCDYSHSSKFLGKALSVTQMAALG